MLQESLNHEWLQWIADPHHTPKPAVRAAPIEGETDLAIQQKRPFASDKYQDTAIEIKLKLLAAPCRFGRGAGLTLGRIVLGGGVRSQRLALSALIWWGFDSLKNQPVRSPFLDVSPRFTIGSTGSSVSKIADTKLVASRTLDTVANLLDWHEVNVA